FFFLKSQQQQQKRTIMADVKTTTARPTAPQGGNRAGKPNNANNFLINTFIVIGCIAVAHLIFHFVFGNPANFSDPATKHVAKNGNLMGTMYSGGWVVPILMSTLLVLLAFVIERAFT